MVQKGQNQKHHIKRNCVIVTFVGETIVTSVGDCVTYVSDYDICGSNSTLNVIVKMTRCTERYVGDFGE